MMSSHLSLAALALIAGLIELSLHPQRTEPGHVRVPAGAWVYVLDLAGDGFQFSSPEQGVLFDVDGTGRRIQTGWTVAGSDDSLLTLDANGNGIVDDGREIFGSAWRREDGSFGTGFEALVLAQGHRLEALRAKPLPKGIAVIDKDDDVFSRLRLWTDINYNGFSETQELQSLAHAKVWSIILSFHRRDVSDRFGNLVTLWGQFIRSPGETYRHMAYVRFART